MSIDELRVSFASALRRDGISAAVARLRDISSSRIRQLLLSVLEDDTVLTSIARDSYAHPNGFQKIILVKSEEPFFRVRLHIWWPSDNHDEAAEHIHNHTWDVCSTVLTGSVQITTYEVDTMGSTFRQYSLPRVPNPDGSYAFQRGERVGLNETSALFLTAGSFYESPSRSIHRVRATIPVTSTLVFQGEFVRSASDVFLPLETPDLEPARIHRMSREMLRGTLTRYLKATENRTGF